MKYFDFYKDEKVTIWERMRFSVIAENRKAAVERVKQLSKTSFVESDDLQINSYEILSETIKALTVEDNQGAPTVKYFEDNGNQVFQI